MPRINNRKFSKGFGILEVLISGAIIIVVLGTLVFIARSAITNAQYMQERAQAISLASEGVEIARQIRDTNYIDGNSDATTKWNTWIGDSSTGIPLDSTTYYISPNLIGNVGQQRLRMLGGSCPTNCTINIDGTNFVRSITFTKPTSTELLTKPAVGSDATNGGNNGFVVKVNITWNGAGGKTNSRVDLSELITNSRFVY